MFRRFRLIHGLIIANLLMLIVVLIKFKNLPPQIPLFYSRPQGEDQLADTWMIISIPVLLNLLYFCNNFLQKRYFSNDDLVKKIFTYLNLFIIVSLSLIFIKIIFVVT